MNVIVSEGIVSFQVNLAFPQIPLFVIEAIPFQIVLSVFITPDGGNQVLEIGF